MLKLLAGPLSLRADILCRALEFAACYAVLLSSGIQDKGNRGLMHPRGQLTSELAETCLTRTVSCPVLAVYDSHQGHDDVDWCVRTRRAFGRWGSKKGSLWAA